MKTLFTLLFLVSSLLLGQAQNIPYALYLNDQESFRGTQRVLAVEEIYTPLKDKTGGKTRTLSRYDAAQRLISRSVYQGEQLRAKDTITYYGPEGVKKATVFESWGADKVYDRRIENYFYDTRGFLVRIREFDKGGYLRSETRIKNAGLGLPIMLGRYDDNDNVLGGDQEAEYLPEQNRFILKKMNKMGKENARDTLVLDLKQRAASPLKGETYNDKGDLIKLEQSPNLFLCYEYRYDEHGNWIEKKCFQVEEEKSREKRVLLEKWERKHQYFSKP